MSLNVDPNNVGQSMQQVSAGEAGAMMEDPYGANVQKYGQAFLDSAVKAGWTPNDGDAGDYVKKQRVAAPAAPAIDPKRLEAIEAEQARVRNADRQSLEEQWDKIIAKETNPAKIKQLLADKDKQMAEEFGGSQPSGSTEHKPSATLIAYREKWQPQLKGADGAAMKAFSEAKLNELAAKYPNADQDQLVAALDKEMDAKYGGGGNRRRAVPAMADGTPMTTAPSSVDENPYGGPITPSTMNPFEKQAFRRLVDVGAYKEDQLDDYLKEYNAGFAGMSEAAIEAERAAENNPTF